MQKCPAKCGNLAYYADCRYAQCHYGEFNYARVIMLSLVMLTVLKLSAIKLGVIMVSFVKLNEYSTRLKRHVKDKRSSLFVHGPSL